MAANSSATLHPATAAQQHAAQLVQSLQQRQQQQQQQQLQRAQFRPHLYLGDATIFKQQQAAKICDPNALQGDEADAVWMQALDPSSVPAAVWEAASLVGGKAALLRCYVELRDNRRGKECDALKLQLAASKTVAGMHAVQQSPTHPAHNFCFGAGSM